MGTVLLAIVLIMFALFAAVILPYVALLGCVVMALNTGAWYWWAGSLFCFAWAFGEPQKES